jgi:hypothetical protein
LTNPCADLRLAYARYRIAFDQTEPVFEEEHRVYRVPKNIPPVNPAHENYGVDRLKRRYQVFVSSTFRDLEEERKHAIQALLMTKCIPTGMELFPAASTKQWNLIKSVIDDCDYYIVIVAGKYGSIGQDGLSYTEMEFDYAVSMGKSILGFFHSNINHLTGNKLESTDEGKRSLANFTEKVKSRMCQPWSTAEGLGSAIKTAILHAIDTDEKPGWIRADALPANRPLQYLEAVDIVELFLEATQRELLITITEFIKDRLPHFLQAQDRDGVYNFVYDDTDQIVRKNRNRVSRFTLKNGEIFKDFLDGACPLDKGIIANAKAEVLRILVSPLDGNSPELIPQALKRSVSAAFRADAESLHNQLRELYRI